MGYFGSSICLILCLANIKGQFLGDFNAVLLTPIPPTGVVPQDPPNLGTPIQTLVPAPVSYDNSIFLPEYDFNKPMAVIEGVLPSSNTPIGEIKMRHPEGRALQLACFEPELVRCFTEYNPAEDAYVASVFLIKILDFEEAPMVPFMFKIQEKVSEAANDFEEDVWQPMIINGLSSGTKVIEVLDINEPPSLSPDLLEITLPSNQMTEEMVPIGGTMFVKDDDLYHGLNGTIGQIFCENTDPELDICHFIQMQSVGQMPSQIQLFFQPALYPPPGDFLFNIVVQDGGDPPLEGRANVFLKVPERQQSMSVDSGDQFPVPEPPPMAVPESFIDSNVRFPNSEPLPNSHLDTEISELPAEIYFDQPEYLFSVVEGDRPGSVVGEFRVFSPVDVSLNVAYGDAPDMFVARISDKQDQQGVIMVELIIKGMVDDLGVIDREARAILENGGMYRAILEVGVHNHQITAPFSVRIVDVDDNPPVLQTLAGAPAESIQLFLPKIPVDGDALTMKNMIQIIDRDLDINSEFIFELSIGPEVTGIDLQESTAKASLIPQFYVRNASKLVEFLADNRIIDAQLTSLQSMLTTVVQVHLLGEVLTAPLQFAEIYYAFEILENSVNQHLIGVAEIPRLTDGLAEFYISGIDITKFQIDNMGQLFLICGPNPFCLDYEEKTTYKLTITAILKDRRLVVPVTINVMDINDNPPQGRVFPEPDIMLDNGKLMRPVYVQGLDADSSDNGAIEFSLLDSSVSNFFRLVNTRKGLAYIEPVEGGPSQSCNPCFLIVQLQDKGEPPLASLLNISVRAAGIPMGKVRFSKQMSSVAILDPYPGMIVEKSNVNLGGVTGVADAPLAVAILDGNDNALFSLHQNGDLAIVKDLEMHESDYGTYNLKLGILRQDSQEVEAEMDVSVEVLEPFWDVQVVEVSKENQLGQPIAELAGGKMMGKQVTMVESEYFDAKGTLINVEKDPFSLNANGLQLILAASVAESHVSRAHLRWNISFEELDGSLREKSVEFLIFVLSTGTETIETTLEGVFFLPWTAESPNVSVKHGSHLIAGQVVAVLAAWDASQNLLLSEYSISGNDSESFNIDEFGVIRASKTVFNSTVLEITAGSSKAYLNITMDPNSAPVLNHTGGIIFMEVSEEALPGQVISSLDLPTKFGYDLVGMGHDNFNVQVKEKDVAITLASNANLDHEKINEFFLILTAKRGAETAGTIPIHIAVTDVNDNSPEFEKSIHKTQILENWPIGSTVYRLNAIDLDGESNGNVSYTLVQESENFAIEEITGEVKTLRPLFGLSKSDPYNLQIRATDSGSPPRSSTTSLEIAVVQESDMQDGIRFAKPPPNFHLKLVENVPVGTVIYTARASDPELDAQSRSKVKFSIADTGNYQYFSINSRSGELRNTVVLDREVQENYSITIMVASGSKSAGRILQIHLKDIDDQVPVFRRLKNSVPAAWTIPHQLSRNNIIGSIAASDLDSEKFSNIYYFITSGNKEKYFDISRNGSIVQVKAFDSVSPSVYNLTILAASKDMLTIPVLDYDPENMSMVQIMLIRSEQSVAKKMKQFSQQDTVFVEPDRWSKRVYLADNKTQSMTGLQLFDVGNAINGMNYSLEGVTFKGFHDHEFNDLIPMEQDQIFQVNTNTGEVYTGPKLIYGQPGSYKAMIMARNGDAWSSDIRAYVHFAPMSSQTRLVFDSVPESLLKKLDNIKRELASIIGAKAGSDIELWMSPLESLGNDRSSFCLFAASETEIISEEITTSAVRSSLQDLKESTGLLDVVPCTDIKHRIETSAISQERPGTAVILLCVLAIALALALVFITMCYWCCFRKSKTGDEDATDSSSMIKQPLPDTEEEIAQKKVSTQTSTASHGQSTIERRPINAVSLIPTKGTDYEWKEKTCKMISK